jgi:hypothetical protein
MSQISAGEVKRRLTTVRESTLQQRDELLYRLLLAAYPSKRAQDS